MKKGPLHSRVLDLINGVDPLAGEWQEHFTTHGYSIHLNESPKISVLSRFEIRKLKEVNERYRNLGTWDLVDLTHEFEEWKSSYPDPTENTSRQISFSQIVDAIGRSEDLEYLQSILSDSTSFDSL